MTYKQVKVELIIIMTRSKDKTQRKNKSNKLTLKNEQEGTKHYKNNRRCVHTNMSHNKCIDLCLVFHVLK
jgi:hypothetical protein